MENFDYANYRNRCISVNRVSPDEKAVRRAREMIGEPYFDRTQPENPSCVDVYVRATGISEEIVNYALKTGDFSRYSERRGNTLVKILEATMGPIGIGFDNRPSNAFFPRRIQNLLPYQAGNDHLYSPDSEAVEGMIIYFAKEGDRIPTHCGVVSEVEEGKPSKVIHASFSRQKVVEDPLENITSSGLNIVAYGSNHSYNKKST